MSREKNAMLWQERVADYRVSGLTAKHWCQQNNVSRSSLKYWITKLNKEDSSPGVEWGMLQVDTPQQASNHSSSGIKLVLNDIEISLDQDFEENTLQKLLQVIKNHA